MGVYLNPYGSNEWFTTVFNNLMGSDTKEIILRTGNKDIEIHINCSSFKKEIKDSTDASMQIDIEELIVPSTGGIVDTDFLNANKNRNKTDNMVDIQILNDATIDRTDAINIFRSGGVATTTNFGDDVDLDFKYLLKRNTDYLILSSILEGASLAIDNEVINFDFSDGINDWVGINATLSVLNNTLSVTSDGTNEFPRAQQNNMKGVSGDKLFIFSKMKIDNNSCNSMQFQTRNNTDGLGTLVTSIPNPINNLFYELFNFHILGIEYQSTVEIRLYHLYDDSIIANGKIMSIEGDINNNGGVFLLNLTEININYPDLDLLNKTASQINDIKYDLLELLDYYNTSLDLDISQLNK